MICEYFIDLIHQSIWVKYSAGQYSPCEGLKLRIYSPIWEEKRDYNSERPMWHEEGATINYCNVEIKFEQIRHGLIQKVSESKRS